MHVNNHKERPILFSTPMVQAILEGRKTMTRRVIKNDKVIELKPEFALKLCPYGQIGDVLWVREAWRLTGWNFNLGRMTIEFADGLITICPAYDPTEDNMWLLNQVEALESKGIIEPSTSEPDAFVFTDKKHPWKPSIHMPKNAARIWLRITNIKIERLHDIRSQDAIKEGIRNLCIAAWEDYNKPEYYCSNPRNSFFSLWISINGTESFESNPLVWVIEFEVLSTTGKPKNL